MNEPLEVVREIHGNLREWLESVRKFPDPTGQPPGTLENISRQLKQVDQAICDADARLVATQAWRDELSAYTETLAKVRAIPQRKRASRISRAATAILRPP